MLFPSPLRHLDLSILPYMAPLRNGAGHDKSTFRFRLICLFSVVVDQFRSNISYNWFHF